MAGATPLSRRWRALPPRRVPATVNGSVWAVSNRQVIHVPGAGHKAPIPAAVRIGTMLFSSAIGGRDPETGQYSDRPEEQAKQAFRNMATLVRSAGGDVGDIAHVTVFLKDPAVKKYVDEEWVEMFP